MYCRINFINLARLSTITETVLLSLSSFWVRPRRFFTYFSGKYIGSISHQLIQSSTRCCRHHPKGGIRWALCAVIVGTSVGALRYEHWLYDNNNWLLKSRFINCGPYNSIYFDCVLHFSTLFWLLRAIIVYQASTCKISLSGTEWSW